MANSVTSLIDQLLARMGAGKVGRGALLSLSIRVALILLGFVQAVLFARLLGAEQYGVFAIVLSISGMVAIVGLMGFGEFAVKEVSKLKANNQFRPIKQFTVRSATSVFAVTLVASVILFFLIPTILSTAHESYVWIIFIAPLIAASLLFRGISQGLGNVFHSQAPNDLIRPAAVVLTLVFISYSATPISSKHGLLIFASASFVAAISALFFLLPRLSISQDAQSPEDGYRISLAGSMPFFLLSLLACAQAELNTVMLGFLSDSRSAGIFQPLLRITPIMVIAAHAINVPMAPRVSELWETHEHDKLRQTVWKATKVSTILVFGTCAVIILIGQWVLSIFGEEFAVMYSALWLLAGAQLFNAACGSSGVLLNMTGHQRSSALCVAAGVLVNLILGIVLIPTWGAWGAAAALAASIITWNTGMLVAVRKHLGFDPSILTAIKKKNIL